MPFELEQIADYKFDDGRIDRMAFDTLIASNRFDNRPDAFAIVSYGGTISSGYVPETESIMPSLDNKAIDLMSELKKLWGVVST